MIKQKKIQKQTHTHTHPQLQTNTFTGTHVFLLFSVFKSRLLVMVEISSSLVLFWLDSFLALRLLIGGSLASLGVLV